MVTELKEYTCMECCRREIDDIDSLINVSHIRLREGDSPTKYRWEFKDKKWVCEKCIARMVKAEKERKENERKENEETIQNKSKS